MRQLLAHLPTSVLGTLLRERSFRRALGPAGRVAAWRKVGATIGAEVKLGSDFSIIRDPKNVSIGEGCSLNDVLVDAWGSVLIGQDVIMNVGIKLFTAQHDIHSVDFDGDTRSIVVGDHAWLPCEICVLPGVSIGRGAIVGTGSVVTRDVPELAVVAGNPAIVIGERADVPFRYRPSRF